MTSSINLWKWEIASFDDFIMPDPKKNITTRSGCIPYTIMEHEAYWLLGSFPDDQKTLTDFGGSCGVLGSVEPTLRKPPRVNYQLPLGCVLQEIAEESRLLLVRPILKSLGTREPIVYLGKKGHYSNIKSQIWMLFVYIEPEEASDFILNFEPEVPDADEKFGPVNLYRAQDVIDGKYKVSPNIEEFRLFLNSACSKDLETCVTKQQGYLKP